MAAKPSSKRVDLCKRPGVCDNELDEDLLRDAVVAERLELGQQHDLEILISVLKKRF